MAHNHKVMRHFVDICLHKRTKIAFEINFNFHNLKQLKGEPTSGSRLYFFKKTKTK